MPLGRSGGGRGRHPDPGDGRRAAALQLDTTDPQSFPRFAEAPGEVLLAWDRESLDVLVNNAGTSGWTPVGQTRAGDVESLVAVHLTGVVLLVEQLLAVLADGGRRTDHQHEHGVGPVHR